MLAKYVLNGTAPDEPATRRKKLRRKITMKTKLHPDFSVQPDQTIECIRGQDGGSHKGILSAINAAQGCVYTTGIIAADSAVGVVDIGK